jgi:nucleotide-binding universal stress UspA family protein
MLKDVMVHLDGTPADDRRLVAADDIAALFDSHVIGLFLHALPDISPETVSAALMADLIEKGRRLADENEAALLERLRSLDKPVEIRRFDELPDAIPQVAAREARAADVFVDVRPGPSAKRSDDDRTVETVLFGSGRHLLLIPDKQRLRDGFGHALVAWNGRREAARAMAEALPYFHKTRAVTVVMVGQREPVEENALVGAEAVAHLRHHGIEARLSHVEATDGGVGPTLIREAGRLKADLIVMGGYGYSHLRERLLGGVSDHLLHHAPVPLVIAH